MPAKAGGNIYAKHPPDAKSKSGPSLARLRPVQVLVQELERAHAVDGVAPVEKLNGGPVAESQLIV